jgi:hypothetical protein
MKAILISIRTHSLRAAAALQKRTKSVADAIPSAIFSRNNSPHSISARSSHVEFASSPLWTAITISLSTEEWLRNARIPCGFRGRSIVRRSGGQHVDTVSTRQRGNSIPSVRNCTKPAYRERTPSSIVPANVPTTREGLGALALHVNFRVTRNPSN